MAASYADVEQLKAWLTIPVSDNTRDTALTAALDSASRYIDEHCGRRFYLDAEASARTYVADLSPARTAILVDDIGALDGLAVETGGTALTGYRTFPSDAIVQEYPIIALVADGGWSAKGTRTVTVTARWGWPTIPGPVVQAALIQAARLWKRKDSPEGVIGSADWGAIRTSRVDPDVMALLSAYRHTKVA